MKQNYNFSSVSMKLKIKLLTNYKRQFIETPISIFFDFGDLGFKY